MARPARLRLHGRGPLLLGTLGQSGLAELAIDDRQVPPADRVRLNGQAVLQHPPGVFIAAAAGQQDARSLAAM